MGNPLQSYTYAYNSSDQLTAQVENGDAASFTYDNAGQLLSGDGISYGYDSNGNRNTGSDAVTTGNEMSADANWNYTYDKEGDLTQKQSTGSSASWTYAYNASSELTEVKQYGSTGTLVQTVDYSYDAFGEEIEQDVTPAGSGTAETKFAYDGWDPNMPAGTGNANFQQWAVLNGDNSLQSRNLNGNIPGSHLARVDQTGASDPSGVYYLLSDRLGSVRDVINASGSSVDAINYDAYGNITAGETDPSYRGRYAWSGQEFDVQTDLQYNNARWYDASTGRWISQDPMGFDAGDSNLYRYVNNAPTNATDASGEDWWPFGDTPGLLDSENRSWRDIPILNFGVALYHGVQLSNAIEEGNKLDAKKAQMDALRAGKKDVLPPSGTFQVAKAGYALNFKYENFTQEQVLSIGNELFQIRSALDDVLSDLKMPNDKTKAQLARWFGGPVSDANMKRIVATFQSVKSGLDGQEKIAKMPSFFNSKKASGDDFAVTNRATSVITLYPLFWDETAVNQTGLLFHELTHLFALTDDYGYIKRAGGAAPNPVYTLDKKQVELTTAKLIDNADTYAGFLQEFYLNKAKK